MIKTRRMYPIGFEISGDMAMFADPTHGSEAASLPVPPPTACIGMTRSISWIPGVEVDVIAAAVCSDVNWANLAYNSKSPFRKRDTVVSDNSCQIREMVLWEPCFQVLAILSNVKLELGKSPAHAMHDRFWKRLSRGQNFSPPSLGRKEFLASYVGVQKTPVNESFSSAIPTMCMKIFDLNSCIDREWRNNVKIQNGVVQYQDVGAKVENGLLTFSDPDLNKEFEFQRNKWGSRC